MTTQTMTVEDRIHATFELRGLRLGALARAVTMAVTAVWLGILVPLSEVSGYC